MLTPHRMLLPSLALAAAMAAPAAGQDANIMFPVDSIERLLAYEPFEIVDMRGSRAEGDRTSRATLTFADGTLLLAKWAPAPPGGETFNNVPRFEVAAYEIQKLFLDPEDYVVPPTVIRAFPLAWVESVDEDNARPTTYGTESVLVVLQYWLFSVTPDDFWDEDRFAADTAYARHFGNFNILTYLVRHNDENVGNFLISQSPTNSRVFSVDNGVTFSSEESDRGHRWRNLRIDRLPAAAIDRLRSLTEEDVIRQLETVAQFRIREDGQLERMESTENLRENEGFRREDDLVQLGLTRREIRDVWRRIERLLSDVEDGDYQLLQ
jgi:hypothetical protein